MRIGTIEVGAFHRKFGAPNVTAHVGDLGNVQVKLSEVATTMLLDILESETRRHVAEFVSTNLKESDK